MRMALQCLAHLLCWSQKGNILNVAMKDNQEYNYSLWCISSVLTIYYWPHQLLFRHIQ